MTFKAPSAGPMWTRIRAFIGTVGVGNLVAAVVFTVAGVVMTADPANGGTPAAAVGSLAITIPVLFARLAPARAAVVQAAGLALNEFLFGPMIRCGFVMPAVLVIVFAIGAAETAQHRARLIGLLAVVATSTMLLAWDPALDSSAALFLASLVAGFLLAGLLIRSRTRMVTSLQRRTDELRRQRDRTAALEVAADRARVGVDLERLIRAQISEISLRAELARTAADGDPDRAREALAEVETVGRATLARMREVVGDLREVPTQPSPGVDQLADLLKGATRAQTRLSVRGDSRPLPATVELSAYRIVEQLLTTLRNHPEARVEVTLRFTDDELEIRVCGPAVSSEIAPPSPSDGEIASPSASDGAMTAVRARAELHGGQVVTRTPTGRRETEVRLPLVSTVSR